jgi:transcriptional regulator with XRE-family HTH domain
MLIEVAKQTGSDSSSSGFGARLRSLREARGLTLAQLSEASGVHLQAIAKLERAANEPTWPTVLKLAKALGVETNEFEAE